MMQFLKTLLILLLFSVPTFGGTTQSRRQRNNRVLSRIETSGNDELEVAEVREVYPTPYPAAGYRPGRAFNLPSEERDESEEGSGFDTTTAEFVEDLYTTTTEAIDAETTTSYYSVPTDFSRNNDTKQGRAAAKAPYPPSGWRPSRAFFLPNEVPAEQDSISDTTTQIDSEVVDAITTSTATPLAPFTTQIPLLDDAVATGTILPQVPISKGKKAPYPPSGWRPNRAFLLPTEIRAANQESRISMNEPEPPVSPADKAGHPACGVSDNPMSPKPVEGANENPDAERVYVTANLGPAVVSAPLTVPFLPRSQRLITPPIYLPVARPFSYSAVVQSWH